MAIAAGHQGDARAGDGGFEARGLGNDEVGGHAAVGPAADAELVGIGDALGYGVIDHGHVVLVVLISPIGKNGFAEFLAIAGRAARIGQKNRIAVGGVELREVVKRSGILADGTAVRIEQRGDFFAGSVIDGFVEIAGDGSAVLALEVNVVGLCEMELREESVVGFGEASQIFLIRKIDFVGSIEHADLRSDCAVFAERIRGYSQAAADGARDFTASDKNATETFCAVVVGNKVDGAAVGGETRSAHAAVECESQDFRLTTGGRGDREMVGRVDHGLDVGLADEGDPFAIGRPGGRAVGTGIGGDLREVRTFVGGIGSDDPDVRVVSGVGIGSGAVAGKGEGFAVGRPGGLGIVEVAGRDLRGFFRGDVEDIEMGTAAVQIADSVALELKTVDDERRRSFRLGSGGGLVFVLLFGGFQVLGLGITKDQNQTSAVRGPFKVVNALGTVGEVSGFATEAIEKQNLGLAIVSSGEKGNVLAVGAPARVGGGDAFGGQGNGITAVIRDHPETLLILVFLKHAGAHSVCDPLAIGAQFGLRDFADLEIIVNGDVAGSGGSNGGSGLRG